MNNFNEILRMLKGQNEPDPVDQTFKSYKFIRPDTFYKDILEGIQYQTETPAQTDPMYLLSKKGLPTNKRGCWWVEYPNRALQEIDKMHSSTNAALRCSGKKLIWDEVIKNNFGTQFYIAIETENYPHKMPTVFLKEAEIMLKKQKHTYRDGSLCLLHPDDYNSNISILQIRNLACAWCWAAEVYVHTKKWPAAETD